MHKIILLSMILFSFFGVKAQSEKGPKILSLQIGYSNPTGLFGSSKDPMKSGFAYGGSLIAIEYTNYCCSHFGWTSILSFANHKVMESRLQDALNKGQSPSSEYTILPNKSSWSSTNLMIGLAYRLPVGKFSFEAKTYGGFFFSKNPNTNIISGPSPLPKYQNTSGDCVGTLGVIVNTSASYKLDNKLSLKLSGGFFYANPTYKGEIKIAEVPTKYSFKQQTSAVDIMLGLSYNFRGNN